MSNPGSINVQNLKLEEHSGVLSYQCMVARYCWGTLSYYYWSLWFELEEHGCRSMREFNCDHHHHRCSTWSLSCLTTSLLVQPESFKLRMRWQSFRLGPGIVNNLIRNSVEYYILQVPPDPVLLSSTILLRSHKEWLHCFGLDWVIRAVCNLHEVIAGSVSITMGAQDCKNCPR